MKSRKRIFQSLGIFVLVFLIGVTGFKLIGGSQWSWLDSLYMTVITLSTVGYGETVDLGGNPGARIFAIVFIILCLGTIAFAVSSITSFIVEGELKNILGRRRMQKRIARLKDHFIVCGTGETALTIIGELVEIRHKFVVVDSSPERIEKLAENEKILFVQGDPADDEVLIEAGIERARGILLSLPTDEINLFVSITARSLNPSIRIVTKGIELQTHKKMRKAGSNAVISPSYIGGMRMVSEMVRPHVVSFLDMMLREREASVRFEEVPVADESRLGGKTLAESKIKENTGLLVAAIRRGASGRFEYNPTGDALINPGDTLIAIADPEQRMALEKLAGAG